MMPTEAFAVIELRAWDWSSAHMTRPAIATRAILKSMQRWRTEHAGRPSVQVGTPMTAAPMRNVYTDHTSWVWDWRLSYSYGRYRFLGWTWWYSEGLNDEGWHVRFNWLHMVPHREPWTKIERVPA